MRIPVFRAGRFANGAIKQMVPGGVVTAEHIKEIAENTAKQIRLTKWRPRVKHGHGASVPTLGWIDKSPDAVGRVLYADVDFNEDGRAIVKSKRARFVSAEIDKGRSLFGDEDSERLGLRLGAVAILPDTDPQLKDLCDLSEAEFGEEDSADGIRIKREFIQELDGDRLAWFAEIEFSETPADGGGTGSTPNEPAVPGKGGNMPTVEELQAQLAEERDARTKAESALEKERKAGRTASFAEYVRKVKSIIADAQKAKKLGRTAAEKALQLGVAMFAFEGEETVATFSETLTAEKVTPAAVTPAALFEELIANLGEATPPQLPEGESREAAGTFSESDFAKASYDVKVSEKINAAFEEAKKKNAKLTFDEFRADCVGTK